MSKHKAAPDVVVERYLVGCEICGHVEGYTRKVGAFDRAIAHRKAHITQEATAASVTVFDRMARLGAYQTFEVASMGTWLYGSVRRSESSR